MSAPLAANDAADSLITLADGNCAIRFDRETGALVGIENVLPRDQMLKAGPSGAPFRVYTDLSGEWLIGSDPRDLAGVTVGEGSGELVSASVDEGRAELVYRGADLRVDLSVALGDAGSSLWELSVTNEGPRARTIVVEFPHLSGVQLGETGAVNLETALNQAGYTGEAWARQKAVYANGGEWAMQWHAIYDPASRSALGFMIEDRDSLAKKMLFAEGRVAVCYFPPLTLAPGETITLPGVRLFVYKGDWRRTARAYGEWYSRELHPVEWPQWAREVDALDGRHFGKASPGVDASTSFMAMMDSFRELPERHLGIPFGILEYAFWSRGSMLWGAHTDGDNVVREDLGGAEAMREGIAGVHKLGLHSSLYVEGYIVHMKSELARDGRAQRWSVMNRDGSISCGYTESGFHGMCPGCVEWQDHLAATAARILRETGADGVRLDSLGFYFLPCYNPAHNHASPFGYNEWLKELLAKVRAAALAVNPDALLTTEAPVDYYGRWFHGALTQAYPRDLSPMRLALAPYRTFAYSFAGPVWGSLSGFAGGRSTFAWEIESAEANWICAQAPVHETVIWGDVADDDPIATDREIITRRYLGEDCDAVVAARPASSEDRWPDQTGLAENHASYQISIPLSGEAPSRIAVCNLEKLAWTSAEPLMRNGHVIISTASNWLLVVIPKGAANFVSFGPLSDVKPGDSFAIRTESLAGDAGSSRIEVWAPGLEVGEGATDAAKCEVGDECRIHVPSNALAGHYQIRVKGEHILGVKRLLNVTR